MAGAAILLMIMCKLGALLLYRVLKCSNCVIEAFRPGGGW